MSRHLLSRARALMGIMHGSRAFGGPVEAGLRLTNRCNIRCIHCYFYSPYLESPNYASLRRARMMHEELPDDAELKQLQGLDFDAGRARTLIDELLGMGTRRFQISGNGEVFLHPEAIELCARIKRAGSYCLTNTNGTLLHRETADELIRMGFDELRITVMGGSPETYERTHPGFTGKTFNTIRDNIKYLTERKAALGLRCPKITLVIIVVRQNYEALLEYARFASEVGADEVLFKPVDDIEDEGLAKVVPTEDQAAYIRAQLPEAKAHLESRGIRNNVDYFLMAFDRQIDTTALYRTIPCYYAWLSVMIDPTGEVMACCRCYNSLGNVSEAKFSDIWNGEPYRALRQEAITLNKRGTPVKGCDCNSCIHYIANMRVFKILHPIKGRSGLLEGCHRASPMMDDRER